MKFESVIGLEVHAQLKTNTKLFSSSNNEFGDDPNSNVSIVDLGLPGVLPVLNQKAVKLAIIAGISTDCKINKKSSFARKHYFYPDLPKGYQISQYDEPIASNGHLEINTDGIVKKIRLNRIHMEEDAGKLIHDISPKYSYVDLNRAGVPLIEIVSEPDISNSLEAVEYLKKLRKILVYAGVSDCDMEKGNFRCDANISVRPIGQKELGIKTEIKNVNSFRYVQKAVDYEISRQIKLIENGGNVVQETRLFNSNTNKTYSMRSKEDAHDYRYFPDPDLQPLILDDKYINQIIYEMPESIDSKTDNYKKMNLSENEIEILLSNIKLSNYFDSTLKYIDDTKIACNWVMKEIIKHIDSIKLEPNNFAELLKLIISGTINNNSAKEILDKILQTNEDPKILVEKMGLKQDSSEESLSEIIDEVIKNNPTEFQRIIDGEVKLLSFFVGQTMKLTKGKGNPQIINQILKKKFKLN